MGRKSRGRRKQAQVPNSCRQPAGPQSHNPAARRPTDARPAGQTTHHGEVVAVHHQRAPPSKVDVFLPPVAHLLVQTDNNEREVGARAGREGTPCKKNNGKWKVVFFELMTARREITFVLQFKKKDQMENKQRCLPADTSQYCYPKRCHLAPRAPQSSHLSIPQSLSAKTGSTGVVFTSPQHDVATPPKRLAISSCSPTEGRLYFLTVLKCTYA